MKINIDKNGVEGEIKYTGLLYMIYSYMTWVIRNWCIFKTVTDTNMKKT
jgi:hypothetical protein